MFKKNIIVFFLLIVFGNSVYSQNDEKSRSWKGFERLNLKFEGRDVRLIIPKESQPEKPWVWRARFPEYHAEIDSALVSHGYYIAYIDTNHMFGSSEAIRVRNKFYKFMVDTYNLCKKVVLHGHSRGGLFTYNWAKVNPDKVACIYVDGPVCDFKSWPAGFGSSKGSYKDWVNLKKAYGFKSDDEAKVYNDNPIDNLEGLVEAKVPIMHSISLKDEVVPANENSLLLVKKYIDLGGMATVYPCVEGEEKSKGHHYSIDNPEMVINFIKQHSISR